MVKRLSLLILLFLVACQGVTKTPDPYPILAESQQDKFYYSHLPIQSVSETVITTPKKGVALASTCGTDRFVGDVRELGGSWFYTWLTAFDGTYPAGVEFVPMIWGATFINTPIGGTSNYILGFNEPDSCIGQSCLTPEQAAVLWRQIEGKYPNKKLVAPSVSSGILDWLDRFVKAYKDIYKVPPRLDSLGAHVYYPTADQGIAYLDQMIQRANWYGAADVWVTEYAMIGAEDVVTQSWALTTWMEYNPRIGRYSIFTNRTECLHPFFGGFYDPYELVSPTELTRLGEAYQEFPYSGGVIR